MALYSGALVNKKQHAFITPRTHQINMNEPFS